jgi:hypothetical protein
MKRLIRYTAHAAGLLTNLGMRKFAIVLILWFHRRSSRTVCLLSRRASSAGCKDGISRDPVLVYQMAKVGSTSLTYSLQFAYLKAGLPEVPVYHAHTLTNLDLHDQLIRESNGQPEDLALVAEYKQVLSRFQSDSHRHWNVVSIVRDPVARHISNYFHHIDRHLPDWRKRWRAGNLSVDEVMQHFLLAEDHAHHWFDTEIKLVMGIDVFCEPFDHYAGYKVLARVPKATLMVIRLEDMDRVAAPAVRQLLGFPEFKLLSFNQASDTGYRAIYQQFRARPLPAWYVEKMYAGKFARHFYTDEERERFTRKWTGALESELKPQPQFGPQRVSA